MGGRRGEEEEEEEEGFIFQKSSCPGSRGCGTCSPSKYALFSIPWDKPYPLPVGAGRGGHTQLLRVGRRSFPHLFKFVRMKEILSL